MRAAKLDWMQRQKEAFRNRQQVTHLAVTLVELPEYRSAEAVCGGRPFGSGSGLYLAKSCTCRVQKMAPAPWERPPPWLAQQHLQCRPRPVCNACSCRVCYRLLPLLQHVQPNLAHTVLQPPDIPCESCLAPHQAGTELHSSPYSKEGSAGCSMSVKLCKLTH